MNPQSNSWTESSEWNKAVPGTAFIFPSDDTVTHPSLASKQHQARKYTARDWDYHKPEISRLYEDGTLQNVMIVMKERHGFEATPKQYKDRIRKWGLQKNIQSEEMEAMIRKQQERELKSDKQTAFFLRDRPVNQDKIDRYKRDHPARHIANEDVDTDRDSGSPVTPADISYYTPSDTGPLMSPGSSSLDPDRALHLNINPQPSVPSPSRVSTYLPGESSRSALPDGSAEQQPTFPLQYSEAPEHGYPVLPRQTSQNQYSPPPPPPTQGAIEFGVGAPKGYSFQYSNCTGRRRALFIGINYFGQTGQLDSCINDVKNMSAFLNECFGYQREDMVILTDDQQNPLSQPTKQNILRGMHWLVKDARPNDSLFFHYSGYGGQAKDLDRDLDSSDNGYDEAIYPIDFRNVGPIIDDEMHRIMVQPLQAGIRLTAIFDSCHSATALDLPYIYSTQGILKEPNLAKEAAQGLLGVVSSYSQGDLGSIASNLMDFFKKFTVRDDAWNKPIAPKTSSADLVIWSSINVDQKSVDADADIASKSTGIVSWAFIKAMKKNREQSYVQLLNSIRDELATRYTEKPQLSCGHPLDTNLLFIM